MSAGIEVSCAAAWTHPSSPSRNRRERPGALTSVQNDIALLVVDQVAEHWGVRPARAGSRVWFEVPAGVSA
jgi:hypothetical protein